MGVDIMAWAGMVCGDVSDDEAIHGIGMINPHDCPQWLLAAITWKPLPFWALFLDSCATCHSMFVVEYLEGIFDADVPLLDHCNMVTLTCRQKGFLGPWEMWLNKQGIANLLSIPQLEEYGYGVD